MSEAPMTMNRRFTSRLHWRALMTCNPRAVGFARADLTARTEDEARAIIEGPRY